jgi:hypothetical protein
MGNDEFRVMNDESQTSAFLSVLRVESDGLAAKCCHPTPVVMRSGYVPLTRNTSIM